MLVLYLACFGHILLPSSQVSLDDAVMCPVNLFKQIMLQFSSLGGAHVHLVGH